jgi:3-dehydroquinate synthase
MHVIPVELGTRSYPIFLGCNIIDRLPKIYRSLKLPLRAVIVCDANVARLHLKVLVSTLRQCTVATTIITVPAGEKHKSLETANKIYSELIKHRHTRTDALIAFGSGVTGDLAGFVAATFRRGMPFIQIPTTLLAQVESAIGGKTGVNHPSSKNAVGAFHQPKLVFSDVQFLSTLSRREIICGLGEAIKYGYLDKKVFAFLDRHIEDILRKDLDILEEVVLRCNAMKATMISEDERETDTTGGRAVLNLGHTLGQALEVLSNFRLHHGEAVLIGLRWELLIAQRVGIVQEKDFARLWRLLSRIPFKPGLQRFSRAALLKHLYSDNTKARFVLPRSIGDVITTASIDKKVMSSTLKELLKH